ncbi:MAG: M28 family peptidase [Crocinitomicaceae bacterium]|nr:M28 family peptidase [Crocinitomicaceae bacterium]
MSKSLSLLGLLLIGFSTNAQIDEVRRITKTLCSQEFHGRGYVNSGDSIAADFLVSEFEKIGVGAYKKEPMLQHFDIDGITRFPGAMSVKQNGKELEPGVHFMVDPSSGGTNKTLDPFKISIETALNRDLLSDEILRFVEDRRGNALYLDFGDAKGDTLNLLRGLGIALAEYHPVIEVIDRKFTWSVGRQKLNNPLIYIQDSIANPNAVFDVNIKVEQLNSYRSQNVIAHIPSKKMCAKTIVFTAHYDHLGRMGESTYFPGANDNASGTAMLISMANYFKEHPSDYNILFIAFAGEEAGLVGSKYFTENPVLKLKKIRFLMNLDIMGSGEEGITAVNATLFEEEFNLLNEINDEKKLLARIKKRGPAANSDHYWFTEKGVPAFFIYTMGPNKNYHDVFDTYDELSFVEYDDITNLLVTFVERLGK